MGKNNSSAYYSIKPNVAYGTPTYIHSHTNSVKKIMDGALPTLKSLSSVTQEIKGNYDKTTLALKNAQLKLSTIQQQLINAGYPVDNSGRPLQISTLLATINKEISDARAAIMGAKKSRRKPKPENLDAKAAELIKELYGNADADTTLNSFFESQGWAEGSGQAIGEYLAQRAATMVTNSRANKKGKQAIFSSKEVLNMSYKEITSYLKNYTPKGQDRLTKQLSSYVMEKVGNVKEEYNRLINRLKISLPVLNNLENIEAAQIDNETKKILKILSDKDQRAELMKLGYLEELAIVQANIQDQANGDIAVKVGDKQINIGSKEGIVGGDSITTDIKGMFDSLDGAITYGISVKLNPRFFRKTEENIPAAKQYQELGKISDAFTNRQNGLIYYILNYQALSLVSYDFVSKEEYRQMYLNDTTPTPKSGALDSKQYNIVRMLEQTLISDAFIKALIGEAFSGFYSGEPTLEAIGAAQGLPVMLQTISGKCWMSDLISNMVGVLDKYRSNPSSIKSIVDNYTPYDLYGGKEAEISELLKDLFKAKMRNSFEKRNKGNNRYDELIQDNEILSILKQLEKINKVRYGTNLNKLLTKKWTIKFDFTPWTPGRSKG